MSDFERIRKALVAAIEAGVDIDMASDLNLADAEDRGELRAVMTEDRILELTAYCTSYQAYLESEQWFRLRGQATARDMDSCCDCGAPATEVHHLVYPEIWGQENLDDLRSLCRTCHVRRHREMDEDAKLRRAEERISKRSPDGA